jgi:hypothetical protein
LSDESETLECRVSSVSDVALKFGFGADVSISSRRSIHMCKERESDVDFARKELTNTPLTHGFLIDSSPCKRLFNIGPSA